MIVKVHEFVNTNSCKVKRRLRPWVCDVGKEDLEGRAWTCEMWLVGHLWGRGPPWRACWPGGPAASAPPLPASGGAALLQPDLHRQPPHTAYRNNKRGLLLAEQSETVKNLDSNKPNHYELRASVYTQDTKSWFLSAKPKM